MNLYLAWYIKRTFLLKSKYILTVPIHHFQHIKIIGISLQLTESKNELPSQKQA